MGVEERKKGGKGKYGERKKGMTEGKERRRKEEGRRKR